MARPGIDNTRQPDSGPKLRYVRVYSISHLQLTVSGATNASPVVIHTTAAHGLSTGNVVKVSGVTGNTAANGIFTITVVDPDHFSLNGSTGSGAYASGGIVQFPQPVKVECLKWDAVSADYITYGGPFAVGGPDDAKKLRVGDRIFIAWRTDSRHWEVIGDNETFRLVRGQSYGIQSGGTILLDNIVVLAGGIDPSNGDPTVQLTVVNEFGASYVNDEWVDAIYNPAISANPLLAWETLKTATGTNTEKFRLIRGLAYNAVDASAATFYIDNVLLLAGSLDPRTVPGSSSELVPITNSQKENFADNEYVTAIYDGGAWVTLPIERFRSIRGTWYSGTSTLVINTIVVLESGIDPRSNPADATETVNVTNVASDTYGSGDKVYADWSVKNNRWEARPKGGGGGGTRHGARVTTSISLATDNLVANWGSGYADLLDDNTGVQAGSPIAVVNPLQVNFDTDFWVELDTSFSPPHVTSGSCEVWFWA